MLKKLFVGGIIGGIVLFLLGWLFYGILLKDFMIAHAGLATGYNRPEFLFLYLILGNLLSGFLLAYVFAKANVNTIGDGLVTGAVVGFLAGASVDSIMYSMTTLMSRTGVAADVATYTVMCAITGAVIALVTGKKQ